MTYTLQHTMTIMDKSYVFYKFTILKHIAIMKLPEYYENLLLI